MKKFYFIILFVLISSVGFANGNYSVSGRVIDTNKKAIPFATVVIANTSIGTVTDLNGNFRLDKIDAGTVQLLIHSIGYEEVKLDIILNEESHVVADAMLKESVHSLNEVQVKGESKSSIIERSGFAVTSTDVSELQSKSVELNEILDRTPGLRVRQDGGLGSNTTFNINGLTGDAVRIFIDGVPMESFGSSYSVNSIPVSLIERVDVYKGVVPIEFGNDALGGAINIVTKKNHKNTLDASYSLGSFNTHRADVNGQVRDEKTGIVFRGSAFYNYSDNNYWVWSDDIKITDYEKYLPDGSLNPDFLAVVKTGEKVHRFNDAYQSMGTKADIGITDKAWADQLFLSMNVSQDYKERQHGPRMLTPYGERFSEGWTIAPSLNYLKKDALIKGLDISSSVQYSLSQQSTVDTTLNQYDWYGNIINPEYITSTNGESGTPTLNADNNTNIVSRFSTSYNITENHLFALNFSNNNFTRKSDDKWQDERIQESTSVLNRYITGATYQNVLVGGRLKNSVFAKHFYNGLESRTNVIDGDGYIEEILDRKDSDWGFGATSTFEVNNRIRINASAEKAIRMVNVNEVFGNAAEEMEGTFDLSPEKSLNFNIGGAFTVYDDGYHDVKFNTNFFYRNMQDRIQRRVVEKNDMSVTIFENIGGILSKGIEAQLDYSIKNEWYFSSQVYYLDSRSMDKTVASGEPNDNYGQREPNMPYFTMNYNLMKTWNGVFKRDDMFSANWNLSYIHEFRNDWEGKGNQNLPMIPTQIINDCGVSYSFADQKTILSLDGKNIFNELAFDNYRVQKPGRAIYLKLTYRIF